MTTLNWCYGAKTPDLHEQIREQLYAAHQYRNKLCQLERTKRDRFYDLLRSFAPDFVLAENDVAVVEEHLGELRETLQRAKSRQRTKQPEGVDVDDLKKRIKCCREYLKVRRADRKEAKNAAKEIDDLQQAIQQNELLYKAERAEAKSNSGLYWGTEAVVSGSCRSFSSGAPPRFLRYDGEGQIAVQLQRGMAVADALEPDTRMYIEGHGRRRTLYFRIGSDGRSPVFAKVPIVMHRNLPPGGRIKWAYLERRMMANQEKWGLRLTIDVPAEDRSIDDSKWAALHVGWHKVPSGLQVAAWSNHDSQSGRLILTNEHLQDYDRLAECQSYRDLMLRDAIDLIREARKDKSSPEWFREATRHCHQWKTFARVAGLLRQMNEHDFSGQDVTLPNTPVELSRRMTPGKPDHQSVVDYFTSSGFVIDDATKSYFTVTRHGESWHIRVSGHTAYRPNQLKYFTLKDGAAAVLFVTALQGGQMSLIGTLQRLQKTDKHLWQHHARLSSRIAKRRTNLYREFAKMLSDKNDVCFLAKPEVAKLTRNALPEDLSDDEKKVHRQARSAAVSDLIRMVGEKFPIRTVEVDSKYLTQQCHKCGGQSTIEDRLCVCECGAKTDMEINALQNTIARGQVLLKGGALLALSEAAEAKSVAAKAKLLKMQEGRRNALKKKTARTQGKTTSE